MIVLEILVGIGVLTAFLLVCYAVGEAVTYRAEAYYSNMDKLILGCCVLVAGGGMVAIAHGIGVAILN